MLFRYIKKLVKKHQPPVVIVAAAPVEVALDNVVKISAGNVAQKFMDELEQSTLHDPGVIVERIGSTNAFKVSISCSPSKDEELREYRNTIVINQIDDLSYGTQLFVADFERQIYPERVN